MSEDGAIPVAAELPAIVNVYVLVSRFPHPAVDHRVGHLFDQLFAHIAAKVVPTVPTHGGRARQPVIPGTRRPLSLADQGQRGDQYCQQEPKHNSQAGAVSVQQTCQPVGISRPHLACRPEPRFHQVTGLNK